MFDMNTGGRGFETQASVWVWGILVICAAALWIWSERLHRRRDDDDKDDEEDGGEDGAPPSA